MTAHQSAISAAIEALAPCPFCGTAPHPLLTSPGKHPAVICNHCGARGPEEMTEAMAVVAWNRRAILSPVAVAWQPIDSAPKDGTILLVGSSIEGWTTQAQFNADRQEWWEINTHWTDAHGDNIYPTHWMPLPAAPSVAPVSQEGEL